MSCKLPRRSFAAERLVLARRRWPAEKGGGDSDGRLRPGRLLVLPLALVLLSILLLPADWGPWAAVTTAADCCCGAKILLRALMNQLDT